MLRKGEEDSISRVGADEGFGEKRRYGLGGGIWRGIWVRFDNKI